jgi:hypothetical protein
LLDLHCDLFGFAVLFDREEHREFVAAGAGAAGALGSALLERFGDSLQHPVAGGVPMKVVDPLEMVEVEKQQHRVALRVEQVDDRAHQLTSVGEAGAGIGVGVSLRQPLGGFIGVERLLQVLRTAPAEQDQGDVEKESDGERARRIAEVRADNRCRHDLAPKHDEQQQRRDRRAGRDDVAARNANRLALSPLHSGPPLRGRNFA